MSILKEHYYLRSVIKHDCDKDISELVCGLTFGFRSLKDLGHVMIYFHITDIKDFSDSDLPSDMQDKLRYKLSKLPRNSSFAQVRNRCISTGRPHSVYEFFRISRIVFRGLASRGPLMGIKKSSW
ncbi:hypothetical protein VNO80_14906 [Phaseolus coccineus]|uniref:Small ribosomal subunit protein uS14m n=1 Tax=Phaseolus coccineus TaxID=3886 RepID=A0AAN9MKL8_PHACN